jgi:hypothetical protein
MPTEQFLALQAPVLIENGAASGLDVMAERYVCLSR